MHSQIRGLKGGVFNINIVSIRIDSVPSFPIEKKWFTEFRCECMSRSDATCSELHILVATPEINAKIHQRHITCLSGFECPLLYVRDTRDECRVC